MTSFDVYTLGCRVNQAESDELASQLLERGFIRVESGADICIINTCTVTGKAAYQSRQAVRRCLKKNPCAKIIVTGCDAEFERETLEKIEGVAAVVGNKNKDDIFKMLDDLNSPSPFWGEGRGEGGASLELPPHLDPLPQGERKNLIRSRPFIKIQDGCESFCSYCIIPYARGPIKSEDAESVLNAIRAHSINGIYEIVLTGIHIGKYGLDISSSLNDLMKRILDGTQIPRIRLSSIESDEVADGLIDTIRDSNGRICSHLHIPMQSGSNSVLKRMNRRYDAQGYSDRIYKIRESLPDICIGADVITGFPGETAAEFQETVAFIEALSIDYLHVFSYSDRQGTKAASMAGKIDEPTKRERTNILRRISTEKRRAYLEKHIGKEVTVVFDKNAVNGFKKGVAENYNNVYVPSNEVKANVHKVVLEGMVGEYMRGRLV